MKCFILLVMIVCSVSTFASENFFVADTLLIPTEKGAKVLYEYKTWSASPSLKSKSAQDFRNTCKNASSILAKHSELPELESVLFTQPRVEISSSTQENNNGNSYEHFMRESNCNLYLSTEADLAIVAVGRKTIKGAERLASNLYQDPRVVAVALVYSNFSFVLPKVLVIQKK